MTRRQLVSRLTSAGFAFGAIAVLHALPGCGVGHGDDGRTVTEAAKKSSKFRELFPEPSKVVRKKSTKRRRSG
jgi:hypothetical protein